MFYIYFDDASGKCAQWVTSRPCWNTEDLTTKETALSEDEIKVLINSIKEKKFMSLDDTYGRAGPYQRYYGERLFVKLGQEEKGVVYQNFPTASAMPEAFKQVKTKLFELVDKKFAEEEQIKNLPNKNSISRFPYEKKVINL